jgi:hypothetical protein
MLHGFVEAGMTSSHTIAEGFAYIPEISNGLNPGTAPSSITSLRMVVLTMMAARLPAR